MQFSMFMPALSSELLYLTACSQLCQHYFLLFLILFFMRPFCSPGRPLAAVPFVDRVLYDQELADDQNADYGNRRQHKNDNGTQHARACGQVSVRPRGLKQFPEQQRRQSNSQQVEQYDYDDSCFHDFPPLYTKGGAWFPAVPPRSAFLYLLSIIHHFTRRGYNFLMALPIHRTFPA